MPFGQVIECRPLTSVTGKFDTMSVEYRTADGIPVTVTFAPFASVVTPVTSDDLFDAGVDTGFGVGDMVGLEVGFGVTVGFPFVREPAFPKVVFADLFPALSYATTAYVWVAVEEKGTSI